MSEPVPPTRDSTSHRERVAAPELDFAMGGVVAGRFSPLGVLGLGPRGMTLRALDRDTGCQVALKLLRTGDSAISACPGPLPPPHPGRLPVLATGEVGSYSLIAQELAEPGGLATRLDGRPWSATEVMELTRGITLALIELHRLGEAHGNLKPQNVFLSGGIRLGDALGVLESTRHGSSLEAAFARLGRYVAPEVARLQRPTPQSDVFSLAVIALELWTGRHPFAGGDLQSFSIRLSAGAPSLPANVTPALAAALTSALDRRPQRRPRDAAEFLALLEGHRPRRRGVRGRDSILAATASVLVVAAAVFVPGSVPRKPEVQPVSTGPVPIRASDAGSGAEPTPQAPPPVHPASAEALAARAREADLNQLRREANLALAAGNDALALARLREARSLDAGDPTLEWRILELEARATSLRTDGRPELLQGVGQDPTLEGVAAARAAASRSDFIAAAAELDRVLATGEEVSPEFAGNVLFNASLMMARAGRCEEAKRYASLAGRYDDPERSMSNRRWSEQLAEVESCNDRRFQALAESLALK